MKKTANKWLLLAALVLFIAGCAIALLPLWQIDIANDQPGHAAYLSHDGKSLYFIRGLKTPDFTLEQYDLNGQLLQQQSLPGLGRTGFYSLPLYPTSDDGFFIKQRSGHSVQLSYFSPADGLRWQDVDTNGLLAADETFAFDKGYVNARDELVFAGSVYSNATPDAPGIPVVGAINRDGMLVVLQRFPNLDSLELFATIPGGDYFAGGNMTDDASAASGNKAVMLHFNNDMTVIAQHEYPDMMYFVGATRNLLIGYDHDKPGSGAFKMSDDNPKPIPVDVEVHRDSLFAGVNQFYVVTGDYSLNVGINQTLCSYTNQFQKLWCKRIASAPSYNTVVEGTVGLNDTLELSVNAENGAVSQVNGSAGGHGSGVTGGISVSFLDTTQITHYVYDASGKLLMTAAEEPQKQEFTSKVCDDRFGRCDVLSPPVPGICSIENVIFLPGDRLFSLGTLCSGADEIAQRLTLWGRS